MRRPTPKYETMLLILGLLTKVLFISMFCSTVLVVLAGIFGLGQEAILVYQMIWGFFLRLCLSLMAIIAIIAMLDSL
ncbi:MAG: hypothetical protein HC929_06940 [Leptolyngbyaceae cyanobacterium SM2_5_2]|nr:hypothetical protein [Leptolyngbyaceae cyanobacterium SM2_5_2]